MGPTLLVVGKWTGVVETYYALVENEAGRLVKCSSNTPFFSLSARLDVLNLHSKLIKDFSEDIFDSPAHDR